MRVLNRYVFDSMAKIPVKIKVPAGRTLDPVTKKTIVNYTVIDAWAGRMRVTDDEVKNSNGLIDFNTIKLMITGEIDPDAIIEVGGKDYRIKMMKSFDGVNVLYLTEA